MAFTLPTWLAALQTVGLAFLSIYAPSAPLAGLIAGAISAAESIPGATGPQKLGAALSIVTNGAAIAKAAGLNIDPVAIQAVATDAIATTVLIANIVSQAKTPAAAVASMSTTPAAA